MGVVVGVCLGTGMESSRYLECLAADAARLREVAGRDLAAAVPSCPGWTVTDLVRHVAEVYLHKTEAMRRGDWPRPWPPDLTGEEPLALLGRAYAGLAAEFARRDPGDATVTWYSPEQTVAFWIRRMAQESVIHRVDAELALGESIAAIPADLAIDGIAEVLERFLSYGSREWADELSDHLAECDGGTVLVSTGGASWLARLTPKGVELTSGPDRDHEAPAAVVTGDPAALLLWLWRRTGHEELDLRAEGKSSVSLEGDPVVLAKLHQLLGDVTQ